MKDGEETQEQVLETGTSQPHRRGRADPRDPKLESPLGRFCMMYGFSGDLYGAGVDYRKIVIEARRALGIHGAGWAPGNSGYTEVADEAKALKEAIKRVADTRAREEESDAALRRISLRLPRVMKNLCDLEIDHIPKDASILRDGLVALHSLYCTGRNKRC